MSYLKLLRLICALVGLFTLVFASGAARAKDYVFVGEGPGDIAHWDNPANWQPNGVPGPDDTAALSTNKSVERNVDVTVTAWTQSDGVMSGPGSLTVTGSLGWTKGEIQGMVNLPASARMDIGGSDVKLLNGTTVNNQGTIAWAGTGELHGGSATLNNAGLFLIQNDAKFTWVFNSSPVINNTGTIRKSDSLGTSDLRVILNQSGTVDVQTGTLTPTNASTFNDGSKFTGVGKTLLGPDQLGVTINGTVTAEGNVELAAGVLKGTDGTSTLAGPGWVWTGGQLQGILTVPPGVTLAVSGTGEKKLNGATLNNQGTIAWTGTGDITDGGGILNNSGLFLIQNDAKFNWVIGSSPLVFNNTGTMRKSDSPGTTILRTKLNQSGTVDVQSGTLSPTYTSAFNDGSKFTGAGKTLLDDGQSDVTIHGTVTAEGKVELAAGVWKGADAQATLSGSGWNWTGGRLQNGSLAVGPGATLALSGAGEKILNGLTLKNNGTIAWTGAGDFTGSTSTIDNDGLFLIQTDAKLGWNFNSRPAFINTGTIRKSDSDGTTATRFALQQRGIVDLRSGTFTIDDNYTQTAGSTLLSGGTLSAANTVKILSGILSGFGTVAGNLLNAGTVGIGAPPGVLTVIGTYSQTPTGTLNVEIGGTPAGSGQLDVKGAATFDGALNLHVAADYKPAANDKITLLKYASRAGNFARLNGLGSVNGLALEPDFLPTELDLKAVAESQPGQPRVWVDVVGRDVMRVNEEQAFNVTYGNAGSGDTTGVLVIRGIPLTATWKIDLPEPPVLNGQKVDWDKLGIDQIIGNEKVIVFPDTRLLAGETRVARIRIFDPSLNINDTFDLGVAWMEGP